MGHDWYRDHHYEPSEDEAEYRSWAQDAGAHVDLTGRVVWPDQPDHPDRRVTAGESTQE